MLTVFDFCSEHHVNDFYFEHDFHKEDLTLQGRIRSFTYVKRTR